MNIEKYTQNAQSAIIESQNLAIENGNQSLEAEHLNLALLRQKDGLIPKLITYMGADPKAVEAAVAFEVGKLPKVSGDAGQIYAVMSPTRGSSSGSPSWRPPGSSPGASIWRPWSSTARSTS